MDKLKQTAGAESAHIWFNWLQLRSNFQIKWVIFFKIETMNHLPLCGHPLSFMSSLINPYTIMLMKAHIGQPCSSH